MIKELNLKNAVSEKEKEIDNLNNKLEIGKNEFLLKEKSLVESYEEKIKNKDEQIAYYKDFKARQSTKMIGESLEQHCNNEFNRIRPIFKMFILRRIMMRELVLREILFLEKVMTTEQKLFQLCSR